MAARWAAGEDIITTCNMEFFSLNALDEEALSCSDVKGLSLDSRNGLDSFNSCLDSSILSIFEDSSAIEAKSRMDEESETTLLTALTEILDNVDNENLSPFDSLPDSEFFSGQKGRDPSPLRRLLSLGRPPADRGILCSPISVSPSPEQVDAVDPDSLWKPSTLPRSQNAVPQRRGGEAEVGEASSLPGGAAGDGDPLDPGGVERTAPPSLDGTCVSMSLSDLVKHMHPYCMRVSLESEAEQGQQKLSEDVSVLEAVDKGEPGEPALVIPDLSFSVPLETGMAELEQSVPEIPKETPSHQDVPLDPARPTDPVLTAEKGDVKVSLRRPKEVVSEKWPSHRKKKRKNKGGEVSNAAGQGVQECPITPPGHSGPCMDVQQVTIGHRYDTQIRQPATQPPSAPLCAVPKPPEEPVSAAMESSFSAAELAPEQFPSSEPEAEGRRATAVSGTEIPRPYEPKPKPLSLQQYRLLRQKRKPTPVGRSEDYSAKWPTLSKPPKELPPIPCLQAAQCRDPRRAVPLQVTSAAADVMPAWRPMGPGAPPTPEALLAPPATMAAYSGKGTACAPRRLSETPSAKPATSSCASCLDANAACCHTAVALANRNAETQRDGQVQQDRTTLRTTSCKASSDVLLHPLVPCDPLLKNATETLTQARRPDGTCPKAGTASPPGDLEAPPATDVLRPDVGPPLGLVLTALSPKERPTEERSPGVTGEIGIEAADLTSLLEQFEETQAKEEQSRPVVSDRTPTTGKTSFEQQPDRKVVERMRIPDLGSTAGLTPPATPPHQVWKPLAPLSLLGKPKPSEVNKLSPSKVIQIDPQPLPPGKVRGKPLPPAGPLPYRVTDHDYSLPLEEPLEKEQGTRWNVKRPRGIPIHVAASAPQRACPAGPAGNTTSCPEKFARQPLDHRTQPEARAQGGSVLLSPETSPCRLKSASVVEAQCVKSRKAYPYSQPSPISPPRKRGRQRVRYRVRSPSSDSSGSESSSQSSSESCSPPRKRLGSRRSKSNSSSSSCSCSPSRSPLRRRRHSYSSSRSASCSRSRSRSRSPQTHRPQWWRCPSYRSPTSRQGHRYGSRDRFQHDKFYKERAIEERRVVYVGRIRGGMTRKELKERFSLYGEIEECTLHFREHGDNYGFITYYNTKDAFTAIENGSELRQPDELPFDLCFGGRRQFCKTTYADLDSNREYEPMSTQGKFETLDFDTLLKQAQKSLKR